jgi:hypothetical protein
MHGLDRGADGRPDLGLALPVLAARPGGLCRLLSEGVRGQQPDTPEPFGSSLNPGLYPPGFAASNVYPGAPPACPAWISRVRRRFARGGTSARLFSGGRSAATGRIVEVEGS